MPHVPDEEEGLPESLPRVEQHQIPKEGRASRNPLMKSIRMADFEPDQKLLDEALNTDQFEGGVDRTAAQSAPSFTQPDLGTEAKGVNGWREPTFQQPEFG